MSTASKGSGAVAVAAVDRTTTDDWRPWSKRYDGSGSMGGPSDVWRRSWDDDEHHGDGFSGFSQKRQQRDEQLPYTPFIAMAAGAFPASDLTWDGLLNSPLFLSDLSHGIGVYEFNMRLIAGTYSVQGSVVNRYG